MKLHTKLFVIVFVLGLFCLVIFYSEQSFKAYLPSLKKEVEFKSLISRSLKTGKTVQFVRILRQVDGDFDSSWRVCYECKVMQDTVMKRILFQKQYSDKNEDPVTTGDLEYRIGIIIQ